jgi:hypothetical protein
MHIQLYRLLILLLFSSAYTFRLPEKGRIKPSFWKITIQAKCQPQLRRHLRQKRLQMQLQSQQARQPTSQHSAR